MITYHGSCASEVSPSMAKAQKVGDNFAKDVQLDEKSYDAFRIPAVLMTPVDMV